MSLSVRAYFDRIAQYVKTQNWGELQWLHLVYVSLSTAQRYSSYANQRLMQDLITMVAPIATTFNPAATALTSSELDAAAAALRGGADNSEMMQDRVLSYLSGLSGPKDSGLDWWRTKLADLGIEPAHFLGEREWPEARPPNLAEPVLSKPAVPEDTGEPPPVPWRERLDGLIGLQGVKRHIRDLSDFIAVERQRQKLGLPKNEIAMHHVFTGPPGTGKTTIARILAEAYFELGVLKTGKLVEVDRSRLVSGYVGQSEQETRSLFLEALNGVLFIDEAYSLVTGDKQDFGARVVDVLVKLMYDYRSSISVIVAGYPEPIKEFIDSNPGLRARFTSYIQFPHYTAEELTQIFRRRLVSMQMRANEDVVKAVDRTLSDLKASRGQSFGNAREVETLWERMLHLQARRIAPLLAMGVERAALVELMPEDIPTADELSGTHT